MASKLSFLNAGHVDETYYDYRFEPYEKLITSIKKYIDFNNHKRFQTQLGSRAPAEYRALAA